MRLVLCESRALSLRAGPTLIVARTDTRNCTALFALYLSRPTRLRRGTRLFFYFKALAPQTHDVLIVSLARAQEPSVWRVEHERTQGELRAAQDSVVVDAAALVDDEQHAAGAARLAAVSGESSRAWPGGGCGGCGGDFGDEASETDIHCRCTRSSAQAERRRRVWVIYSRRLLSFFLSFFLSFSSLSVSQYCFCGGCCCCCCFCDDGMRPVSSHVVMICRLLTIRGGGGIGVPIRLAATARYDDDYILGVFSANVRSDNG